MAGAATACPKKVIADWSDNGRVDRVYALDCYQQAIEAMPPDIRDYTDAHDSIERALTIAVRAKSPDRDAPARAPARAGIVGTSGGTTVPLSLFVLGALAVAILAAGTGTYAARYAAWRGTRGRTR